MSIERQSPECLDAGVLAAFVEGRMTPGEIPAVLAHLRECPACMSAVETANEVIRTEPARPFRWWWAAAAAIVAALVTALLLPRPGAPIARLARFAPDARPVETRLTPFAWKPYRGPLRSGDRAEDARRLQLAGAAGDAVARADADASARAQWTAGIALVMVGEPDNALKRLRLAAEHAPDDAAIWSDLAAALDAAAIHDERKSLHAEALAAADRALAADASQPAALFNRALILEHLGLAGKAREAWDRYLVVDPSSQWANEAREHLRRLPQTTGDGRFRAAQRDLAQVAALVPAFPQQSRAYAESPYLGRWGASGDVACLDAARAIGDALVRVSGESLLRDSVRVIDAATGEHRARLAAAHALYDRARVALSRHDAVGAQRDLTSAAASFEQAGSPMSLAARYFAACARFEADDVAGARGELERLLVESGEHPGYLALRAQIDWQLATVSFSDADWVGSLAYLNDAERLFRRLGERSNLAFIRGMQSTAIGCLGRPDEAWAARIDAFRVLDSEGLADRLPVTLGGAARMELHAGRLDTAEAFLRLEVEALRPLEDHAQVANALVRETLLQLQRGNAAAAANAAREAATEARSLSGPAREVALADASLAQGAVALESDLPAALRALDAASDFYRASQRMLFLPQACLLRARAARRNGDRVSALRDLEEGMNILDRHRRLAGPLAGADILDAGVTLAQDAIRLRVEMGDAAGAFREVERRNLRTAAIAGPAIALDALQRDLAGSRSAVLMLTMLPGEVNAIAITSRDVAIARAPLDERTLESRIRGAVEGRRDDAESLYDALIRPSGKALAGRERLIVVADPSLREVPYAALYDRVARRHLIETVTVAMAENASSLRNEERGTSRLAVVVALPSSEMEPLPDAPRELEEVKSLYAESMSIEPTFAAFGSAASHAAVVHLAGHTSRLPGMTDRVLPFAQHGATWRDISGLRFDGDAVVTLAACETLCQPDAGRTSGRSLGGAVLAAGAADVIGTLAPIADRDAAELFREIHRGLASGMSAAEALRRAQLEALAAETATGRRTSWRAVALLTRRLPPAPERRT